MLKKALFFACFIGIYGCSSTDGHLDTEFDSQICIKPMLDYHYTTCNTLKFKVNDVEFIVPKDFETDLASIPKIAWPILAPSHSSLIRPAIVHDWLYKNACYFTRKQSDLIFYHFLVNDGVSHFKSSIMYYAVRLFGWNYYSANFCTHGIKNMDIETRYSQLAFLGLNED